MSYVIICGLLRVIALMCLEKATMFGEKPRIDAQTLQETETVVRLSRMRTHLRRVESSMIIVSCCFVLIMKRVIVSSGWGHRIIQQQFSLNWLFQRWEELFQQPRKFTISLSKTYLCAPLKIFEYSLSSKSNKF